MPSQTLPDGLEPLLSTRQLAEYLNLNQQAIYDLRLHGRGPRVIRVGRELRFRVCDVHAWLDQLAEPATGVAEGGDRNGR